MNDIYNCLVLLAKNLQLNSSGGGVGGGIYINSMLIFSYNWCFTCDGNDCLERQNVQRGVPTRSCFGNDIGDSGVQCLGW